MKAFVLANLSDVFSTITGLNAGAIEANPIIHLFMENTSVSEALLVQTGPGFGDWPVFIHRWKPRLLTVPTLVFTLAAISNSVVALASL
jgi:hypothetical protein